MAEAVVDLREVLNEFSGRFATKSDLEEIKKSIIELREMLESDEEVKQEFIGEIIDEPIGDFLATSIGAGASDVVLDWIRKVVPIPLVGTTGNIIAGAGLRLLGRRWIGGTIGHYLDRVGRGILYNAAGNFLRGFLGAVMREEEVTLENYY